MKHLRVRASVDPAGAPEFFTLLADSPSIEETRCLDWNMATDEYTTLLYAIHGETDAFRRSATDTSGIESVELSAVDETPTYALVRARPFAVPMFDSISRAISRAGLVVRKPIVYRDCEVRARAVGDPEPLKAALEQAPDPVDPVVEEIGTFRGRTERPESRLSDRQREAVDAAMRLGYYDYPRRATHEDVAEALDCAPATASEHLQKAESKLLGALLDDFGPGAERR